MGKEISENNYYRRGAKAMSPKSDETEKYFDLIPVYTDEKYKDRCVFCNAVQNDMFVLHGKSVCCRCLSEFKEK